MESITERMVQWRRITRRQAAKRNHVDKEGRHGQINGGRRIEEGWKS
jgi:hypothetical protein